MLFLNGKIKKVMYQVATSDEVGIAFKKGCVIPANSHQNLFEDIWLH
jgi:hypothetical protein